MARRLALLAPALGVALLASRAPAAPVTQVHAVMGTWLTITAAGGDVHGGMTACFRDARDLDETFSRWDPASELSRLHAAAGGPVAVSDAMAALTRRALALRAATEGAFDPTVGPLTALYRDASEPDPVALLAARAASGPGAVVLDDGRLVLRPGARLDFDGIAKGWAVDRCIERLRAAGVHDALVSLGESSVAALGAPDHHDAWPLAVRGTDPDTVVGTLWLRDEALSVSATHGGPGAGHPHIVDPASGRLLTEPAVGVVLARSATDAEAWSKALLIWGRDGPSRVEAGGADGALRITPAGIERGARLAAGGRFQALAAPRALRDAEEPLR